ncbi:MAG: hypothetical protein KC431_31195, partial [Myxococcales bacterium]|nr:hypothetical protein [Myxococcales bacterium]
QPPPIASWSLTEHQLTGLATSLKNLGEAQCADLSCRQPVGYFIKSIPCIARPVWDVDVIADRIRRYPRVDATRLGRRGPRTVNFDRGPMVALLFRKHIIGILQAV